MLDDPSTEKDKLSAVEIIRVEMQEKVRRLATPCEPGESVKSCVRRVSRATGLTFGQVRRLWYSEWRIIPAHVADRIREAVHAHDRRVIETIESNKRRNAALYAILHHSSDPEFYGGQPGVGSQEAE